MPKKYKHKNPHLLMDGDEMANALANIDKLVRSEGASKAIRTAGKKYILKEFRRKVPIGTGPKKGFLKRKTRFKVNQTDKFGRKWIGRVVAPHVHLFEKGFEHADKEGNKTGVKVKGRFLIPKIKKKASQQITSEMMRVLLEFAKTSPNLRRKSGNR